MGQIFLFINIDHPDIVYLRKQNLQRQKTGDRMALTICRNNALKRSASMTVDKLVPIRIEGSNFYKAIVRPWYFKNVNTVQEMQQMCGKVMGGNPDPDVDTVIIETEAKDVSFEDIEAAEATVAEPGDKQETPPSNASAKKAAPVKEKEEKKAPRKEEKVSGDMKEKMKALAEIASERAELKKNLRNCKNEHQKENIESKLAELDVEEVAVNELS